MSERLRSCRNGCRKAAFSRHPTIRRYVMSATDYLKSLAAEIAGVSIDKSRLEAESAADMHDDVGHQQRPDARDIPSDAGYPARDDVDISGSTVSSPLRKT